MFTKLKVSYFVINSRSPASTVLIICFFIRKSYAGRRRGRDAKYAENRGHLRIPRGPPRRPAGKPDDDTRDKQPSNDR